MALLLHLSDLHLTSGATDNLGDDKAKILQPRQAQSRRQKMHDSLGELALSLRRAGQELDSVVITGDITSFGSPEGFAFLPEVLAGLDDLVPPERVLIVPGNHDVPAGTPASSPERYAPFLDLRRHGYRTAYLEGVDIHDDGLPLADGAMQPIITAGDGSFVLVGLNSANNSWVPDGRYRELEKEIAAVRKGKPNAVVKALLDKIDAGSSADLARVDKAQLVAATRLLREEEEDQPRARLRIVALHHQIAPVSSTEEVKAFESITNLGAFRQWLAGSEISVVLHGHKHQGAALVESFTPTQAEGDDPHILLVLSAPSLQFGTASVFGRLIDIPPVALGVGGIQIADVPATDAGVGYPFEKLKRRYLALDHSAELGLIAGSTADDVYRRILAQRKRLVNLPSPFVCRIEDGSSALVVPSGYPDIPEGLDPQKWFDTTVEWWQRRPRGRAAKFNHGERLFRQSAEHGDRIDRIVDEFGKKPETSRAIALLVDGRGDLDHKEKDYPAFVSVQFVIEGSRLNLVAYYRKQEMPHWWPINVGELAWLQKDVIARLQEKGRVVKAGSISTVTAMPADGTGIPRVAVPWIDRIADSDEHLLPLVLPLLAASSVASRTGISERWMRVSADWTPGADEPTDGDPVPALGLRRLQSVLERSAQVEVDNRPTISRLCSTLGALADANQVYLAAEGSAKPPARRAWINKVRSLTADITAAISALAIDETRAKD